MNAIVAFQQPSVGHTILGRRPPRMPVGGVIRAGIQVLSKSAASVPKVQQIYDAGVAAQEPFETIEKRIQEQVPELKKKALFPKNTPWFVVRRGDFNPPELADLIMEKYGTVREDGIKRLWSLPVVFPVDQWEMLLPHTYQSFTASGLKYWSEFGPDGAMRCMTFEPVAINPATKRAVKMAGGRNRIQRPDNGGYCDPDHCAQFQRKECQLRGKLYFFIPGIPTIALMQLSTGSINGLEAVRSQMMTVAAARRGRLSGFLDDDAATFVLSKQQMEVPGIDEETGQPIRRQQHIITLSAKMDLTQLYRVQNPRLLTHQGGEAAAVLNGEAVITMPDHQVAESGDIEGSDATSAGELQTSPSQSRNAPPAQAVSVPPAEKSSVSASPNAMPDYPVAESGDIEGSDAASADELQTNPSQSRNTPPAQAVSVPPAERSSVSASPNDSASSSATPLDEIYRMLDEMKIDRELFDKYALKKWGSWKANAKGVEKVIGDVTANRNDPDAYVKKIDSEVNVFS